jgi:hypothetical protein
MVAIADNYDGGEPIRTKEFGGVEGVLLGAMRAILKEQGFGGDPLGSDEAASHFGLAGNGRITLGASADDEGRQTLGVEGGSVEGAAGERWTRHTPRIDPGAEDDNGLGGLGAILQAKSVHEGEEERVEEQEGEKEAEEAHGVRMSEGG